MQPEGERELEPKRVSSFQAWLDGLVGAGSPRGEVGLQLSEELFAALGRPQDSAISVHVVGTAGKGSVVGLLTDRLVASGLRVATHQSPHVHDVRERFLLDGALPAWPVVLDAADAVMESAVEVTRRLGRPPSYFAATAAMAWELGRRHEAEIFVIEAGIGGRFDATNVIGRDDTITVVTAVGLDHVDVLGSTIEEIAAEKAAVLEGRSDVVLGPQPDGLAEAVVRRMAEGFGSVVHPVVGVFGDWKEEAMATVDVAAARVEERLARHIPSVAMRLPPGRFESLDVGRRSLILDGAHNPMKLDALVRSLPDRGVDCVVVAVGRGKNLDECAAALARLPAPMIATEFGPPRIVEAGPRSWPASALAAALRRHGAAAEDAPTPELAATAALAATEAGDTILVTGSFLHLTGLRDQFGQG